MDEFGLWENPVPNYSDQSGEENVLFNSEVSNVTSDEAKETLKGMS